MSDNKVDGRYTFSQAVRMPFSNLFEPKPVGKRGKAKGTPKYSSTFLVSPDSPDLAAMKAKAIAVAKAKWPNRDLKELKFPWELGDKRIAKEQAQATKEGRAPRDNSFMAGQLAVTARSLYAPQLAVLSGGVIAEYQDDKRPLAKQKIYNGCYVVAQINFAAYDGQQDEDTGAGNPDGVNAYLDMVMKVKEGDRIGGANISNTFKSYVGTVTDEDPTAGAGEDLSDI